MNLEISTGNLKVDAVSQIRINGTYKKFEIHACPICGNEGIARKKGNAAFKICSRICETDMDIRFREGILCLKCGGFIPYWSGDDYLYDGILMT